VASDASSFIVRPAAEVDIEEAGLWYELRSLGLGADLLRAVEVCFEQIRRRPLSFQQVYKTARRARIRRFPYVVYFVSMSTRHPDCGVHACEERSADLAPTCRPLTS
jgi:hypothetical protein